MADEKKCVTCGKKLRNGTSFATCPEHRTKEEQQAAWRRAAEQKRVKGGGKPRARKSDDDRVLDALDLAKSAEAPPKTKSDAMKRFRVVAEAMGYDAEQLLSTYCEGWLAAVKAEIDKIEAPGE